MSPAEYQTTQAQLFMLSGMMLRLQVGEMLRNIGLSHGILFNVTADNVIRLLPPLIISDEEIEELVTRLSKTMHTFLEEEKSDLSAG